jgi:hypothetical protein
MAPGTIAREITKAKANIIISFSFAISRLLSNSC